MQARPQPYAHGRFLIAPGSACAAAAERFVREERFLDMAGARRLATTNLHREVYALRLAGSDADVIVKKQWINPVAPLRRRVGQALLWPLKDKCWQALKGAWAMRAAGLDTCDPIAYWTHRAAGRCEYRYLMYERVPARESVRAVRERLLGDAVRKRNLLRERRGAPVPEPDAEAVRMLDAFTLAQADYVRRLHAAGLRHRDLCSGNWLYEGTRLWLIDTDSVCQARVGWAPWKRVMDLRSLRRLDLSRRERKLFLARYLGHDNRPLWLCVMEFWWYGPRRSLMGGGA